MTVTVAMITLDTANALTIGRWWAEQTGGEIVAENEGWFVTVALGDGQPMLAFQKVDDPTPGKNRIHIDFLADDHRAEAQRLVAAGATLIEERSMPTGPDTSFSWTTLADPDGNEFCVADRGTH